MSDSRKICCLCAMPELLEQCQKKNCNQSFHLHCISGFFPELKTTGLCPSHSCKGLEQISKLTHLANLFNTSEFLSETLKSQKNDQKNKNLTGDVFWYGISQQYFPYHTLEKPNFNSQSPKTASSFPESSWITTKIQNVTGKLSAVSESIQKLTQPLKNLTKNCCKTPKSGENLKNSTKLALNLRSKLQRNSQKIKLKGYKHHLNNYHHHDSEEKIICAVCDNGESFEDNLIVICSKCELAVHCWCYNIQDLPKHDWLCDVCLTNSEKPVCTLCPISRGALKQANSSSWVHITCAQHLLSVPSNVFIWDLSQINPEKFLLRCFSCNLKTGACVQCSHGRCPTAFHVECRKDLIEISQNPVRWLCPSHKASKLSREIKNAQDASDQFIFNIANILWKKFFSEEHPKTEKIKKMANLSFKKKIELEIRKEQILMKVLVGKKIVRVLKYKEENGEDEGKEKVNRLKFEQEGGNGGGNMRGKKGGKGEVIVLETCKGGFTIKIKVRSGMDEGGTQKRRKIEKEGGDKMNQLSY